MAFFSDVPPPGAEHERILREQSITLDEPGPLVRDFETLIDVVGPDGMRVSATKHVLYSGDLPELSARLTRPFEADYKRPTQKGYPYIHGLYLLLRATGMTYLTEKRHHRLMLRDAVVQSWDALNPTERYMTLLEAWINRADEDAIMGRGFMAFGNLDRALHLLGNLPDDGTTASSRVLSELRYYPGFYNLALMDLFGFVHLEEEGTEAGEGWHVTHVARRPFGEALLRLVAWLRQERVRDQDALWEDPDETPFLSREALQDFLRDYFPEWQRTLAAPQDAFRAGVHVFKVALSKKCWRRIAVPGALPLDALSDEILRAFAFEDWHHLYQFTYRDAFGYERHVNMGSEYAHTDPPFTDEVRVGDVPLSVGDGMTYVFDFGDWWEFDVALERLDSEDAALEDACAEGAVTLDAEGPAVQQYPDWDDEV